MTEHRMNQIERGGSDIVAGNGTEPSAGAGPVERSFLIRPALPCGTCDHAVVCSIKPRLETASIEYRTPASPDPAVHVRASLTIECDYYRAAVEPSVRLTPTGPVFKRTVSEAERIATSSARGTAASKAARANGTAGSSVGSLSTLRGAGPPKKKNSTAAWTPERRAEQSERMKLIAARQAKP